MPRFCLTGRPRPDIPADVIAALENPRSGPAPSSAPRSPRSDDGPARSLRVCHVGKYYPPAPGGIESHVRTLAQAQADLGMGVEVLAINHRPGPTVDEQDGPVGVTRLGCLATVAKFSICPDWVSRLSRAAARADVVHIHVPNPMAIIAALAAGVRRPTVVTYHSDHIAQRLTAALFRPVEHLFYPRVGAILATSPVYAEGSDLLRAYADRVAVLPHGIDTAPFAAPTAEDRREAARLRAAHAPDGGPVWLAAGRLIYYKGLSTALRALAKTEGTLLIIGEGPDRAALEAEAARLGVARRAVFPGKVASLVPYYLAADAFWFPSNARSEAFGLVQVEAMAAGCPVINTAIPYSGVSWVCRDGESGLTVPVDDPDALAAAARRLATEPGLRARLSAGARRRVAEDFDHRVMARRSVEVYFGVLRNRARAR